MDSEVAKAFGEQRVQGALKVVDMLITRSFANVDLLDNERDKPEEIVAAVDEFLTSDARQRLLVAAREIPDDPALESANTALQLVSAAYGNDQVQTREPYVSRQTVTDATASVGEDGELVIVARVTTDYPYTVDGKPTTYRITRDQTYYLLPQPTEAQGQPWLVDAWAAEIYEHEEVK